MDLNDKKFGFTLSEVLIVLGIIGVIASLTIPGLIQDVQDAQLKVAWKNVYSIIDQASRRVLMDNAGNFKGLCNDNSHDCLRDKYLPYLLYTKSCNTNQAFGNCWINGSDWKYLNGSLTGWGNLNSIVLNNGSFLRFSWASKACTDPFGSALRCGALIIDLNGFNGPNLVGKDILGANIYENSINSWGFSGDGLINTCNKSSTGIGCSAEYLYK